MMRIGSGIGEAAHQTPASRPESSDVSFAETASSAMPEDARPRTRSGVAHDASGRSGDAEKKHSKDPVITVESVKLGLHQQQFDHQSALLRSGLNRFMPRLAARATKGDGSAVRVGRMESAVRGVLRQPPSDKRAETIDAMTKGVRRTPMPSSSSKNLLALLQSASSSNLSDAGLRRPDESDNSSFTVG